MREARAEHFSSEEILILATTDQKCPGDGVVQNSEEVSLLAKYYYTELMKSKSR